MSGLRCIFCMNEMKDSSQVCPVCGKGIWEYEWEERWLEPYTFLRDRYLIGAVTREQENGTVYLGFDQIMEQKILVRAYGMEGWKHGKEKAARLLFGKFDIPGIAGIQDYFVLGDNGYIITPWKNGISVREYLQKRHRIPEREITRMMEPFLEGIGRLHALGLVHGGISPEGMLITPEHELWLLTDGRDYAPQQEENAYLAPEQQEEKESGIRKTGQERLIGPWTDIYAVCALWYQMLTGREVPPASRRKKKDRCKKPSVYAAADERTEQALMQGLALDVQRRYFCVENLMESMGLKTERVQELSGITRHIWGNSWLEATRRPAVYQKKEGRRYLLRRIAAATAVLACISGIVAGAGWIYVRTHPDEVIAWQADRARERFRNNGKKSVLTRESQEYDQVMAFIKEYGDRSEDSSGDQADSYTFTEEDLRHCPEFYGSEGYFYLDEKTVMKALDTYMDLGGQLDVSDESWSGEASVTKEDQEIIMYLTKSYTYRARKSGEEVQIRYDPSDGQMQGITFQGTGSRCARFLREILPLLIQETRLTEEEIQEIIRLDFSIAGTRYIQLAGGYDIMFTIPWEEEQRAERTEKTEDPEDRILKISVTGKSMGLRDLETEENYAGNYERGSKEYQEFLSFIEERALSREETVRADAPALQDRQQTIYTLDPEDVQEWGQPSNYLQFVTDADELYKALESGNMELTFAEQEEEDTVTVDRYGGIATSFIRRDRYRTAEGTVISINKDSINDRVMGVVIYQDGGNEGSLSGAALEVTAALLGEAPEELPELSEFLAEAEADPESSVNNNFMTVGSAALMITDGEQADFQIIIVPALTFEADYYWP